MKILHKYISKSIFYPTISIISILSAIILVTQSLKYIDLVVTHGIRMVDFLNLSFLLVPSLLFVIMPICLFIAVLYSLNKLKSQREINIIKGVGVSNYNFAKPVIEVAFFIMIIHYAISLYVMPEVNHKFKNLSSTLKENYVTFFLQENVFIHPTNELTFFIKQKMGENKFKKIFFHDENDGQPITIFADSGEIKKEKGRVYLHLFNGNRQEITKNGELNVLNFEKLVWQYKDNKEIGGVRSKTIQEQHIDELLFNDLPSNSPIKKRMFTEANQRIIFPFYNLILTMVALITILKGEHSRSGDIKRIISFVLLASAIVIINTSLINLSSSYVYLIVLSYIFTIGVTIKLYNELLLRDR